MKISSFLKRKLRTWIFFAESYSDMSCLSIRTARTYVVSTFSNFAFRFTDDPEIYIRHFNCYGILTLNMIFNSLIENSFLFWIILMCRSSYQYPRENFESTTKTRLSTIGLSSCFSGKKIVIVQVIGRWVISSIESMWELETQCMLFTCLYWKAYHLSVGSKLDRWEKN